MKNFDLNSETIYKVVKNQHGRYSITPSGVLLPNGWKNSGVEGSKSDCLLYVKSAWTDTKVYYLENKIDVPSNNVPDSLQLNSNSKCFHHLFEEQVLRNPNSLSVVCESQQLSYSELNRRANQISHYLLKLKNVSDIKIGVMLNRSVDMLAAILGILKAGGVFVPLDPTYPHDRLSYIVEQTNLSILLTSASLQNILSDKVDNIICVDTDLRKTIQENTKNPSEKISPSDIAYIIYTSGSTGEPKGVLIKQSSLHYYAQSFGESIGINCSDVYLHSASLAFSASVRQLLLPLAYGATILISTDEQRKNPLALFNLIKNQKVTIIDTVPSFLRSCTEAIVNSADKIEKLSLLSTIRLILTTGEPLSSHLTKFWLDELKNNVRVFNLYGLTETSGSVSIHSVCPSDCKLKMIPIGRPISNTKIFILDNDLKPLPDETSGEIYISGNRVAVGYLNQPEKTAQNFLPDPYSDQAGSCLFKTGDIGRYLPDGNIEFIGRIDFQVNIRGMRIELEEIELVLNQYPDIIEAAVTTYEDKSHEKYLVAYFVKDKKKEPSISELHNFLNQKLPEYMIPSFFVPIDALPRTTSGKIDRSTLPDPLQRRLNLNTQFIAPSSQLQHYLSSIWHEILNLEKIGIHDKFLELGGTSLLAARIVNKIQEKLDLFIPIISIFEAPTIYEYSSFLTKNYSLAITKIFPADNMSGYNLKTNSSAQIKNQAHSTIKTPQRTFAENQRRLRLQRRKSI